MTISSETGLALQEATVNRKGKHGVKSKIGIRGELDIRSVWRGVANSIDTLPVSKLQGTLLRAFNKLTQYSRAVETQDISKCKRHFFNLEDVKKMRDEWQKKVEFLNHVINCKKRNLPLPQLPMSAHTKKHQRAVCETSTSPNDFSHVYEFTPANQTLEAIM